MTNQLSGDALSRAVALVLGWKQDTAKQWAVNRHGKHAKWSQLLYAEDNSLVGEMMEWLSTRKIKRKQVWCELGYYPSQNEWQASCCHPECVKCYYGTGQSKNEALARCILAVAKKQAW